MHCCHEELDSTQAQTDAAINVQMNEETKRRDREIRLLLLGAGDSGKSTLAKQLRILHGHGFNDEEKESYTKSILQNIWEGIGALYNASQTLGVHIKRKDNRLFAVTFLQPFLGEIPSQQESQIIALWDDPGIKKLWAKRNEFQLVDSFDYYMRNISRILAKDFRPNEQDMLRVRIQTTGVITTSFDVSGKTFTLVDVGGQRSERKKWVHCFEGVLGVLFCVALSEFDQTLYEDNKTNRMLEAKKVFHEVCQSKWFSDTAMILFLNKEDIFKEKVEAGSTIRSAFLDYGGRDNYKESIEFIETKFRDVVNPTTGKKREVYVHVTTATDTTCVSVVFKAVSQFIVQYAFQNVGMV